MKKIITFILSTILVLAMSTTALASNGGFVSSPSLNGTPAIKDVESSDSSCTADWILTSYADRGTLPADKKNDIEKVYKDIADIDNAMNLNAPGLAELVGNKDAVLAVSDLFDLSYVGCDAHAEHGKTSFTLEADTLKNFKALLCYTNGEWKVVNGASVNGNKLSFETQDFSIFAILVDVDVQNDDGPVNTGDNARFLWYGAVMLVSLVGIVAVVGVKARSAKKSR